MQPSQQYPSQSGYRGEPGDPRRPGFAPAPPQTGLVRVQPWLTGVVAALTMLVLIAGVANQGVTDQINKHNLDPTKFFDDFVRATQVYSWRFSAPLGTDIGRLWLASVLFDVAVIVLTLLVTTALVRNKKGFGGAFLGTWAAVVFATMVSGYVRTAVIDYNALPQQRLGKGVSIFFSTYSPGALTVFASLLYGLVAAVIAGAVAAATRRTEILAAPEPGYGDQREAEAGYASEQRRDTDDRQAWTAPPPAPVAAPSPWTDKRREDDPQPTAVLPAVDDRSPSGEHPDAQQTTQFPAQGRDDSLRKDSSTPWSSGAPGSTPWSSGRNDHAEGDRSESTQAYRVPIDGDEPPEATQAHRVPREQESQTRDEGDATQAYRIPREDEDTR